jgi:hypothetical protein
MLKIRGISNAENLLMGVNRFGHCLNYVLCLFYSLLKNDRPDLPFTLENDYIMLSLSRKHRPGHHYTEFA